MFGFESWGETLPGWNGYADSGTGAYQNDWSGGAYDAASGFTIGGGGGGASIGGTFPASGGINITLPTGGSGGGSGPDVNEILTALVNAAERALQANLGAWQANQVSADAAVERAWSILNDVVARMMAYGIQGRNSAAERDRRIEPARLRWDWIAYYIEPITGPLSVPSGSGSGTTGTGSGSGAGSGTGSPYPPITSAGLGLAGIPDWALVGAVIVVLLFMQRR